MNSVNLINRLHLDSYDLDIPLSQTKNEILTLLAHGNVLVKTTSSGCSVIESELLGTGIHFCVYLRFNEENISMVTIVPRSDLESGDIYFRYRRIQDALVHELGGPRFGIHSIMNILNHSNIRNVWKVSNIIVEHLLYERFTFEESITIKL